jgi:hypothetical protein
LVGFCILAQTLLIVLQHGFELQQKRRPQ